MVGLEHWDCPKIEVHVREIDKFPGMVLNFSVQVNWVPVVLVGGKGGLDAGVVRHGGFVEVCSGRPLD